MAIGGLHLHETSTHDVACPERGRHDKEGRQRALVEAATAVFAERGFDAATTREVAERAGCSEGLIHRYFGGKRGLLMAVVELRALSVGRDFEEQVGQFERLEDEIRAILAYAVQSASSARDCLRVSVGQAIVDPDIGQSVGRLFCDRRAERVRRRLERHREAGRVRADADLAAAAQAIVGVGFACGFMSQVVFQRTALEVEQVSSAAAEIFARGLSPEADTTGPARGAD
jgi:AcrR family transcriptional regulator